MKKEEKQTIEFGWKYNEPWRKVIINKTPDSGRYFLQVYDYHFDDKKNLVKKDLIINSVVESIDILHKD